MVRLRDALKSVVYGSAFLAFWAWLAVEARALDAVLGGPLPAAARPAGPVLIALGALLAAACAATLVGRGRGTPAPFDPPREFVAAGPYRWVRNPMYIGGLTALVGYGLWERSPAVLLYTFLLFLLAHAFVVLYEEPDLEQRFGGDYRGYRRRVGRWLPGPPWRK